MSTARKILWEEMFPDELREAIETCPLCLTCFGLAEPHGPYNAIGLDYLKARALIERSARENGGVVAPPFCWHVQERPEFDWCGKHGVEQAYASSITADLFLQMVLQQVRAFDARGFHAAILVTGHYGGLENDIRLLCEFYTRRTGSPIRLAAFADWELIDFENYRGDHAGVCETSQLMALRPELVDLDRTVDNSPLGKFCGSAFPSKSGVMPRADLGENIVSSQIRRLAEVQAELLGSYRPPDGWEAPTLNDVSDLWNRFERLTRKYWWFSRTLGEYGRKSGVDFPGWEELGE